MLVPFGHAGGAIKSRFHQARERARYHADRALDVLADKTRETAERLARADAVVRRPLYYGGNAALFAEGMGALPEGTGRAAYDTAKSYEAIRQGLTGEKSWIPLAH